MTMTAAPPCPFCGGVWSTGMRSPETSAVQACAPAKDMQSVHPRARALFIAHARDKKFYVTRHCVSTSGRPWLDGYRQPRTYSAGAARTGVPCAARCVFTSAIDTSFR